MKLLVTLLTSHDIRRFSRLVHTCTLVEQVPNLEMYPVIVVNTLNEQYYREVLAADFPYPVIRTESNGWPGKGKNSCQDIFLKSDADFLLQMDGDDFFYPSLAKSLSGILGRYKGSLDVLGIHPADKVTGMSLDCGYQFNWSSSEYPTLYGTVWGISVCWPSSLQPGPRRGDWWDEEMPVSQNTIFIRSKKSCEHRYPEDIPNGEDSFLGCVLFAAHQRGELNYFVSMSSDFYCYDDITENSIQKQEPWRHWVGIWKERVEKVLNADRSNYMELPVIYQDLKITAPEKEAWIRKHY
jgi:hypothetical protein